MHIKHPLLDHIASTVYEPKHLIFNIALRDEYYSNFYFAYEKKTRSGGGTCLKISRLYRPNPIREDFWDFCFRNSE